MDYRSVKVMRKHPLMAAGDQGAAADDEERDEQALVLISLTCEFPERTGLSRVSQPVRLQQAQIRYESTSFGKPRAGADAVNPAPLPLKHGHCCSLQLQKNIWNNGHSG